MNIYEIYPNIYDKYIPLSLLEVSSRNYIHWKKENLLYKFTEKDVNSKEKRERILLNVYDALWIFIIKELREFNVDFPTIRAVKDIMYANIEFNQELLDATSKEDFINSVLTNIPEAHREVFRPFMLDGSFINIITDFIDEKNMFLFKNIGSLLFDVLARDISLSLLVAKENDFVTTRFLKIDPNSKLNSSQVIETLVSNYVTEQTFLSIPISNLVWKIFESPKFEKYNLKYQFFSENERVILDALHNDACKEIKVFKHESGDVTLNLVFEDALRQDQAREVRKILGLNQYEKMELTYRNDKHIVIKNTKKQILKQQ
jgi:hypothetical protein